MSIPARYPSRELPNLVMNHHRNDTIWQIAAIFCGLWCVILLGWVGVLEYQKWMGQ